VDDGDSLIAPVLHLQRNTLYVGPRLKSPSGGLSRAWRTHGPSKSQSAIFCVVVDSALNIGLGPVLFIAPKFNQSLASHLQYSTKAKAYDVREMPCLPWISTP